jgi:two-component system CheB/CheR fusion protein
LLDYLKRSRGFDFSGYKRPSLMRRIRKRMQAVEVNDFGDYIDYLEVHPQEFTSLFNGILINVTSFFRDPPAWEYIAGEIVPRIVRDKRPAELIRIWDAGCASGEEAYTLAIVLAEALGEQQFRERVKIYATDIDNEALGQARQASYSARDLNGLAPELIERYFEVANDRYIFRKNLRPSVIFGRHDLLQDAPISRIDLLVCRNTLMYFNAEAQTRILTRFNFALAEGGFLVLGKAEMLFTHVNLFLPVDLKRRVFTKVSRPALRDRLLLLAQPGDDEGGNHVTRQDRVREAAFDASPTAQFVVNTGGLLQLANERARLLFGLFANDIGRPIQELALSYRVLPLRGGIEQAIAERRPIQIKDVEWSIPNGEGRVLDLFVAPLLDPGNGLLAVSVSATDVTAYRRLQEEVEHANQELETAYEELQSTNEELETTNEELQSTIEELETTNEELQSTNEELETMNEELQSTNEELQTINDEIRRRTDELNEVNSFLESILTSLRVGVVVVDRDLLVRVWNHKAEDLWGLREDEVQGQHFLNLDIGLPVQQIRQPMRACLAGEADYRDIVLPATNRRGRTIECKVGCTPLLGAGREIRGVILLMEEDGDARLA